MAAVKERLAVLGTEFTQNLLADERGWFMELAEADLAGLPDFVVAAARAAGEEKGAEGPVVTLSRSLIVPFLQFSPRRDLRERAYAAWVARGANGGRDRQPGAGRRDPGAEAGAGGAAGLSLVRGLQAGDRDGEDPGRGARPADAGLGAGAGQRRGRCRGAGGDDARRGGQWCAGALGLALLCREAAPGRARPG